MSAVKIQLSVYSNKRLSVMEKREKFHFTPQ